LIKAFHIDCELDYDVTQQTLFVFNLAVASMHTQRIIAETVAASSDATMDEFRDEAGHNRFFRLDVAPRQSFLGDDWRGRPSTLERRTKNPQVGAIKFLHRK
jgi:hypothetical protein